MFDTAIESDLGMVNFLLLFLILNHRILRGSHVVNIGVAVIDFGPILLILRLMPLGLHLRFATRALLVLPIFRQDGRKEFDIERIFHQQLH